MAYVKQTWVDQEGQVRYTETTDGSYKIFTPNYDNVTEMGTPVNALNMNHIEDGIEDVHIKIDGLFETIYPIGSIYIGMTSTCPLASLFGTWVKITGGLTLQQADSSHPVGTEIPAGLPEIEGTWKVDGTDCASTGTDAFSGPVISQKGPGNYHHSGQSGAVRGFTYQASLSSSVYGSSNTVQPPALAVNIWQRTA